MTKRICELEKGNVFIYMGIPSIVTAIKGSCIYYRSVSDNATTSNRHSFGANCKAKVEMAGYVIRKSGVGAVKNIKSPRFKKGNIPKTYKINDKGY